jgi:DNA-binding NarL/FixJ family response regulator
VKLLVERRCGVAVFDPQPIVVEGLRAVLAASGSYWMLEPAGSLDSLTRLIVSSAPHITVVDKAIGVPVLVDWLDRIRERNTSAVVVWASSVTDGEALRLLKAGARGVIRKTAEPATLLACIGAVASGATWMEDALFAETARRDSGGRTDLTVREQQVLELVEQGLRNKDIAGELGIKPGTVKIHLKHIFEKTGVHGRFGLALSGIRERTPILRRLAS